jgi:circadian clock protein KaiC
MVTMDETQPRMIRNAATIARRVVIDSLAGYGSMVSPAGPLQNFLHAVVTLLRQQHITALLCHENPEMLGMSTMSGAMEVSSLVDNILLLNWVELGDTFRLGLTVAKARAMPTSRATYECEIVDGRGLQVLPRAVPVPHLPFARYYGLLSRAPERRSSRPTRRKPRG